VLLYIYYKIVQLVSTYVIRCLYRIILLVNVRHKGAKMLPSTSGLHGTNSYRYRFVHGHGVTVLPSCGNCSPDVAVCPAINSLRCVVARWRCWLTSCLLYTELNGSWTFNASALLQMESCVQWSVCICAYMPLCVCGTGARGQSHDSWQLLHDSLRGKKSSPSGEQLKSINLLLKITCSCWELLNYVWCVLSVTDQMYRIKAKFLQNSMIHITI